jgi:hypothetical protein
MPISEGIKSVLAIIGVVALILLVFAGGILVASHQATQTVVTVQEVVPAPTPVPAPVSVPAVIPPTVLTYTVLSTTTYAGHYEVFTTTGTVLYCMDFVTWNRQFPQNTYTATISPNGDGTYTIETTTLISVSPTYENPVYYTYGNYYYRCDGYSCNSVLYNDVRTTHVIHEYPPHPVYGNTHVYSNPEPSPHPAPHPVPHFEPTPIPTPVPTPVPTPPHYHPPTNGGTGIHHDPSIGSH